MANEKMRHIVTGYVLDQAFGLDPAQLGRAIGAIKAHYEAIDQECLNLGLTVPPASLLLRAILPAAEPKNHLKTPLAISTEGTVDADTPIVFTTDSLATISSSEIPGINMDTPKPAPARENIQPATIGLHETTPDMSTEIITTNPADQDILTIAPQLPETEKHLSLEEAERQLVLAGIKPNVDVSGFHYASVANENLIKDVFVGELAELEGTARLKMIRKLQNRIYRLLRKFIWDLQDPVEKRTTPKLTASIAADARASHPLYSGISDDQLIDLLERKLNPEVLIKQQEASAQFTEKGDIPTTEEPTSTGIFVDSLDTTRKAIIEESDPDVVVNAAFGTPPPAIGAVEPPETLLVEQASAEIEETDMAGVLNQPPIITVEEIPTTRTEPERTVVFAENAASVVPQETTVLKPGIEVIELVVDIKPTADPVEKEIFTESPHAPANPSIRFNLGNEPTTRQFTDLSIKTPEPDSKPAVQPKTASQAAPKRAREIIQQASVTILHKEVTSARNTRSHIPQGRHGQITERHYPTGRNRIQQTQHLLKPPHVNIADVIAAVNKAARARKEARDKYFMS